MVPNDDNNTTNKTPLSQIRDGGRQKTLKSFFSTTTTVSSSNKKKKSDDAIKMIKLTLGEKEDSKLSHGDDENRKPTHISSSFSGEKENTKEEKESIGVVFAKEKEKVQAIAADDDAKQVTKGGDVSKKNGAQNAPSLASVSEERKGVEMIAEATRATGRTTSTVKENERTEEKMDVDVDFEEEEEEENPISFARRNKRKRSNAASSIAKRPTRATRREEEEAKRKRKKTVIMDSSDDDENEEEEGGSESDFAPEESEDGDDDDEDEDFEEEDSPVANKKTKKKPPSAQASKASATVAPIKQRASPPKQQPSSSQQQNGLQADQISKFDERERRLFSFMFPPKLKDHNGNLFDSPKYDPTTLLLPKTFPKSFPSTDGSQHKISPGQQQWWQFKATHFDAVLLFKMGKFYEMYEMDAHVGVKELGLIYMKGEQPHAGFPEKNYQKNAETLARNGHKVVTIEQTETPAMLAERKKKDSRCKDTVVKREKIAVVTRGTMIDRVMVESCPDASHVLAISEFRKNEDGAMHFGVCAAECAAGKFVLGAYKVVPGSGDEETLSSLRTTLCELNPVEIIFRRGKTDAKEFPGPAVAAALRDCVPNAHIRYVCSSSMTSSKGVREEVEKQGYFKPLAAYPDVIETFFGNASNINAEAALVAFGTCLLYLNDNLVAHDVVPYGKYETIANDETFFGVEGSVVNSSAPPSPSAMEQEATTTSAATTKRLQYQHAFMRLDAAALSGLEILENTEGGRSGSLLELVSRAASAPGTRVLRMQCCRPSCDASVIRSKQKAIDALRSNDSVDTFQKIRALLKASPDYERCVARCVGSGDSNRNADRVVLYEDMRKAKLNDFLAALESVRAVRDVAEEISSNEHVLEKSNLLRALVTGEKTNADEEDYCGDLFFPKDEIIKALREFETAFDWVKAKECGRIEPAAGVDAAVDAADEAIRQADAKLENWLDEARALLQCQKSELQFVTVMRDTHIIEIPDRLSRRVPEMWTREGKRKGFERFSCETVDPLREARANAMEAKETAMEGVMKGLILKFRANWREWRLATECIAEVDALGALAVVSDEFALLGEGHAVKPNVSPFPGDGKSAFLECDVLTHPCASLLNKQFVPNDCHFAADKNFLLLSGANMGGKSTYLRQICVATILAHMGSSVPAKTFNLSACDAIFVRMGARDDLRSGFSTFAVEMSEIAKPLREATKNSLVCVDELGRGTSTTDGCAIALSCGKHLMLRNKSRTLFSTHYHKLADYFAFASSAILKHVEALVDSTRVPPRVAFTHKVVSGSCPKSHGVNVARLAGLPETVLQTASAVASRAEKSDEENAFQGGKECSIGARAGVQYLFSRFREEKALFFADDEKSGISSAIETVREALFLTHE